MLIRLAVVSASAFGLCLALTPVVRALARRTQMVARPVGDRWHRQTIPLLGGVAIFSSFLLTAAAFNGGALLVLLACGSLIFLLGLADDLWRLGASTKLVGQLAISAALIYLVPPLHLTGWPVVDQLIALLWLVGITNAFNLLDNVDGLAAGVALLSAVFYVPVLWNAGTPEMLTAVAAFAGATAGFLVYNSQPASIFMGDCGSLFLGFFLAGASLMVAPGLQSRVVAVAAVPALILLVPIFDTTFVTLTRRLAGRSPLVGGRDHTSHRLVALGIGERRAVMLLYLLTAVGGVVALSVQRLGAGRGSIAIAAYAILLAALGVLLGQVNVAQGEREVSTSEQPLLGEITARNRVIEILLDVALIGLAYYAAFALRFRGEEFAHFFPYFAASVPIIVGCQLAGLWISGKYRQVWRSFGASEISTIVKGIAIGGAGSVILVLYLYRFVGFSRAVFVTQAGLLLVLLIGSRVAISRLDDYLLRQRRTGRSVVIYGAGRRGLLLVRELLENPTFRLVPLGFVDDDRAKRRLRVEGLPVLGSGDELESVLARWKPDELLLSTELIAPERLRTAQARCRAAGVKIRRLRFNLEELQ